MAMLDVSLPARMLRADQRGPSLKAEQTSVVEKAYYRRGYYRRGYYHRRYYGGYYHRGYGYGYGYHRRCWWRYGRRICRW